MHSKTQVSRARITLTSAVYRFEDSQTTRRSLFLPPRISDSPFHHRTTVTTMKIGIQTLASKKFSVEIDEKENVLALKQRIHSELNLGEVEDQKLIFLGKVLKVSGNGNTTAWSRACIESLPFGSHLTSLLMYSTLERAIN